MNIPLDRLYHYIETVAEQIHGDRVVIYRFYPHGSKNIADLNELQDFKKKSELNEWCAKVVYPAIWCNDQEPLDHEFYGTNLRITNTPTSRVPKNLNYTTNNIFEKALLLHSEKRSHNLKKYQLDGELIPVYYWSHAVISRDWFRYAEHVTQRKQVDKTFLIYNRAWSGTREYRLRFAELLVQLNLHDHCQTTVNPIEPELGTHYTQHHFKNPAWQPQIVLENYFPTSCAHSSYSADFDIEDYETTDIEVVLETLFDDDRLQLTEKSLRPMACAQPFILAATHGSLEYLRSYGFKTFSNIWDESYDQCVDPEERLAKIVNLMQEIVNWNPDVRVSKMAQAQVIADYNRKYFFSEEFFDLVVNELKTNFKLAFDELAQCNNFRPWIDRWSQLIKNPQVLDYLEKGQIEPGSPSLDKVKFVLNLAQQHLQS